MVNKGFFAKYAVLLLGMLLLAGCGREPELVFSAAEEVSGEVSGAESADTEFQELSDPVICVYICGEVANPGVYTLREGARVYELIDAAGGLTEDADGRYINQAAVLSDGQQVTVPAAAETAGSALPGLTYTEEAAKININTADEAALMTLPGIGKARAAAVIEYRTQHGPFARPEDIQNVSGIKGAVFEKIKDAITV